MTIELSIVIVEYHSVDEICSCVDRIFSKLSLPFEIIVSSNSCYTQAEQEKVQTSEPRVKWLFNEQNGGFAYAMNKGLKASCGEYVVIMNSDCMVNSDMEDMVAFMRRHPDVGVVGPKIHDEEGNLQDSARSYVSLPHFVWRQIKRMMFHRVCVLNSHMDYDKTQTVDWVIGAFMMVSREAYVKTGGLDDCFFMYAEDLDWCTRIRQAGFEVVYYADSEIIYKGTRRARSDMNYAKIFLRSHLLYWKKFGFVCGYPKRRHVLFEKE